MIDATVLSRTTPTAAGFREISPAVALENLRAFRVIDVREPGEYTGELGHVAGAELVPLATVPAVAQAWNRETPTLVICRSGGRSGRAASVLVQLGFREVFNLTGGMLAWDALGLPREFGRAGAAA